VRVGLFVTCVNDAMFPDVGKATVRVLERLGHSVTFPMSQSCCGQPHYNSGYHEEAAQLVPRFVAAFQGCDYVVAPAGSCVAMVREGHPRLARDSGDDFLRAQVDELAPRVLDLSEFLVDVLGVTDVGATFPFSVTYHSACHGRRVLAAEPGDGGLDSRYLRLLGSVRGIDLRPLPGMAECCGFGGTFAVKNSDVSGAIGNDKADAVLSTEAAVVTASDSSCLMHIGGTLMKRKERVRFLHAAEILACTAEDRETWRAEPRQPTPSGPTEAVR
jgi:L-lactate dehydrogenase complex protein LldE